MNALYKVRHGLESRLFILLLGCFWVVVESCTQRASGPSEASKAPPLVSPTTNPEPEPKLERPLINPHGIGKTSITGIGNDFNNNIKNEDIPEVFYRRPLIYQNIKQYSPVWINLNQRQWVGVTKVGEGIGKGLDSLVGKDISGYVTGFWANPEEKAALGYLLPSVHEIVSYPMLIPGTNKQYSALNLTHVIFKKSEKTFDETSLFLTQSPVYQDESKDPKPFFKPAKEFEKVAVYIDPTAEATLKTCNDLFEGKVAFSAKTQQMCDPLFDMRTYIPFETLRMKQSVVIWRAVSEPGYNCLGMFATNSESLKPDTSNYYQQGPVCLRSDLLVPGKLELMFTSSQLHFFRVIPRGDDGLGMLSLYVINGTVSLDSAAKIPVWVIKKSAMSDLNATAGKQ